MKKKLLHLSLILGLSTVSVWAMDPPPFNDGPMTGPTNPPPLLPIRAKKPMVKSTEAYETFCAYLKENFFDLAKDPQPFFEFSQGEQLKKAVHEPFYSLFMGYFCMANHRVYQGVDFLTKPGVVMSPDDQEVIVNYIYYKLEPHPSIDYEELRQMYQLPELSNNQRRDCLTKLAAHGYTKAQEKINYAAAYGKLGFNRETGRTYLEDRINEGDRNAQYWINNAACDAITPYNVFNPPVTPSWIEFKETGPGYLEAREAKGNDHALRMLMDAAANGRLGFDDFTGCSLLKTYAAQGNQYANEKLDEAAYFGDLGFDNVTGRKRLEDRAAKGNDHALRMLMKAAANGRLGFDDKTGLLLLETYAAQGHEYALYELAGAAKRKSLGFTDDTARQALKIYAAQGNQDAQEYLNQAARFGQELGFNNETGQDYLKKRALLGDKSAQEIINDKAYASFFFRAYNIIMGFEE
ncbi:MAG: hypothetical protein K2X98_01320 [Alphaproteobacteria bacterium]|nr:hypothetical protein [Alphaproteobacteria bacterium]